MCNGITKKGEKCKNKSANVYCHLHSLKSEECPVCTYPLSDKDILSCGHWIHMECIRKSFKFECPVCRSHLQLTPKTVRQIEQNQKIINKEWEIEYEDQIRAEYQDELGGYGIRIMLVEII